MPKIIFVLALFAVWVPSAWAEEPVRAVIVKVRQIDHGVPVMGQILTIRNGGSDYTGETERDPATGKVTGGYKLTLAPRIEDDGRIQFTLTLKLRGRKTVDPEIQETVVDDGSPGTVDFPQLHFQAIVTAHKLPPGQAELPPDVAATLDDDD